MVLENWSKTAITGFIVSLIFWIYSLQWTIHNWTLSFMLAPFGINQMTILAVPFFAIVFSIFGIIYTRKRQKKGRFLAIFGLIIGATPYLGMNPIAITITLIIGVIWLIAFLAKKFVYKFLDVEKKN